MKLTLAAKVFADKYQNEMSMEAYLNYLEKGFDLLKENALDQYNELKDLKAIRMALEFRVEFMAVRLKNRKQSVSAFTSAFAG